MIQVTALERWSLKQVWLYWIICVQAWGMHNNATATIIVMIFIEIFIIKDNTATNSLLCYFWNTQSQGSHYFEIRGRSDFSFRCWQKRSERQQGEVKIFLQLYHFSHSQGIIVVFVCYNVLAMHQGIFSSCLIPCFC